MAGQLYCSEPVIGWRAHSFLSVIGVLPQSGPHCKTLVFPGSFCWLTLVSSSPVGVRGQAELP